MATGASDTGLGVVLLQDQENIRHPVIYLSRKVFAKEKKSVFYLRGMFGDYLGLG